MIWMFMAPANFIDWNPKPQVDGIGRWDIGMCLGHEGGAFMNNRIGALIEEAWESSLTLSTEWGQSKKLAANQKAARYQKTHFPMPWSQISQSPEWWEINFCCLYATSLWSFCYTSPNRLRRAFTLHDMRSHHKLLSRGDTCSGDMRITQTCVSRSDFRQARTEAGREMAGPTNSSASGNNVTFWCTGRENRRIFWGSSCEVRHRGIKDDSKAEVQAILPSSFQGWASVLNAPISQGAKREDRPGALDSDLDLNLGSKCVSLSDLWLYLTTSVEYYNTWIVIPLW